MQGEYVHIDICTYIYINMHIHVHVHTCLHIYIYMCIYIYIYLYLYYNPEPKKLDRGSAHQDPRPEDAVSARPGSPSLLPGHRWLEALEPLLRRT